MEQQASQGWSTDPGLKPNAPPPKPPHDNPQAVEHAQIGSLDKQEGGKEMGLVHAPIVSMHPTSQKQGEGATEPKFRVVDDAFIHLTADEKMHHVEFKYPFNELQIGQGLFVEVEQGSTTDKLMKEMYKQVAQYRKQNSEVERDEDGDDVMEDVCINKKKINEDGTVQLDGDKPRLTVKSGFRPKLVGPNFTVKAVVKDDELADGDKAEADGAFIVRVS